MMQDFLKKMLEDSGADAWEIVDTYTEGWEFYFIRHRLDQNRVRNVEHINVTVYRKSADGSTMGQASGEIQPSADFAEAEKQVSMLLGQTKLVKNLVYNLNTPSGAETDLRNEKTNVSLIAGDFIDTLKNIPETETEDINSYEIFVNGKTRRYMNSNGIDITTNAPSSFIEVVVNARKDDEEIELYRSYTSGTCDRAYLTKDLTKALSYGKDRLLAEKTPDIKKSAVLFSTNDAVNIYSYFVDRVNARLAYSGISNPVVGEEIIKGAAGDKITISTVKKLTNSSRNGDFDAEGAPIKEKVLIRGNVTETIIGPRQYSQYLGLEESFIPGNFVVDGGTRTDEEMRSGSVLEVVQFSDLQVDQMTGDVAGEIRLGYLHEGNSVKIVTGGSISGNIEELAKNMYFSKSQTQYDNWRIPSLTRIEGMQIAAAQ